MKNHWFDKYNKFYFGIILGLLFPIIGFFISFLVIGSGHSLEAFWGIFIKDSSVFSGEITETYNEIRQNILIFSLMTNLLLFYFSFFMFKIDRFSKGLVAITLILAALSMLFIY